MISSKEAFSFFGDPHKAESKHMTLWIIPEDIRSASSVIPKKIYCNKLLVKPLESAFRALISTGHIDELKTFDGCFNIRQMRGGVSFSLHSWGIAVDVNAATNKFGGTPSLSEDFVKCFTDNGFDWGGHWKTTKDGMHFQLSTLSDKVEKKTPEVAIKADRTPLSEYTSSELINELQMRIKNVE